MLDAKRTCNSFPYLQISYLVDKISRESNPKVLDLGVENGRSRVRRLRPRFICAAQSGFEGLQPRDRRGGRVDPLGAPGASPLPVPKGGRKRAVPITRSLKRRLWVVRTSLKSSLSLDRPFGIHLSGTANHGDFLPWTARSKGSQMCSEPPTACGQPQKMVALHLALRPCTVNQHVIQPMRVM